MSIAAIIVSYLPERESFISLLQNLIQQVDHVLVLDNSPADHLAAQYFFDESGIDATRSSFIRLNDNYGIAVALNVGIRKAMGLGVDFVLLSDQDSLPASDMVENLYRSYEGLYTQQVRVGAIGPTYTDLHTGLTYPFQVDLPGCFFYGHKAGSEESPLVEALTLITSGTLIPMDVFEDVGLMREDFFIRPSRYRMVSPGTLERIPYFRQLQGANVSANGRRKIGCMVSPVAKGNRLQTTTYLLQDKEFYRTLENTFHRVAVEGAGELVFAGHNIYACVFQQIFGGNVKNGGTGPLGWHQRQNGMLSRVISKAH